MYTHLDSECHKCDYFAGNQKADIVRNHIIENPRLTDVRTLSDQGISNNRTGCTNSSGKKGPCSLDQKVRFPSR